MVQFQQPYVTTRKTIILTIQTFVSKVLSLLFNPLSRFVIAFLPRSNHLLISWLQSPSAVILEPKKRKPITASTFFPSICHEVMGPNQFSCLVPQLCLTIWDPMKQQTTGFPVSPQLVSSYGNRRILGTYSIFLVLFCLPLCTSLSYFGYILDLCCFFFSTDILSLLFSLYSRKYAVLTSWAYMF